MNDPSRPSPPSDELWKRLTELPTLREEPLPADDVRVDRRRPNPAPSSPAAGANGMQAPATVAVPRARQAPPRGPGTPAAQPPLPGPPVAPLPGGRRPRRSRRGRRGRTIVLIVLVLFIVAALGGLAYARWQWSRLDRVEVAEVLTPGGPGPTNWLVVGSDTREGFDLSRDDVGFVAGEVVTGQRSDTMMVLSMGDGEARLLSLPRDLWLPIAGTGDNGRLNSAFATGGAPRLIRTVQSSLGIPVHHYAEIDFTGFGELVEAVGGIDVEFEHPAFDHGSGLNVPEAGVVHLDGAQALAYVRSRYYTEIIDGREVRDGSADLGRTERQRAFMSSLMNEVGGARAPWTVHRVVSAFAGSVTVDDDLSLWDAFSLARRLGGLSAAPEALPVVDHVTGSGAQVLLLGQGADEVLDRFR